MVDPEKRQCSSRGNFHPQWKKMDKEKKEQTDESINIHQPPLGTIAYSKAALGQDENNLLCLHKQLHPRKYI